MIIKVDKEGQKAIRDLCDIALRSGGLNNFAAIQYILRSVVPLSEDSAAPVKEDSKKEGKAPRKKVDK